MKAWCKTSFLTGLRVTGMMGLCRVLHRNQIIILAYHGVDKFHDPVWNHDGLQIHPELFESQLQFLCRTYQPVTLHQVREHVLHGKPLPPRPVALTFDDGYENNLTVAAPLLKKYGVPATVFCTTGFIDGSISPWWYRVRGLILNAVGREVPLPNGASSVLQSPGDKAKAARAWEAHLKNQTHEERESAILQLAATLKTPFSESPYPLMNWDQVRELSGYGVDVAPHTVRHVSLGAESESVVRREIADSVAEFRTQIGPSPLLYSYPYGQADHRKSSVLKTLSEEGIDLAVTAEHGYNSGWENPLELKRMNDGRHPILRLEAMMAGFCK